MEYHNHGATASGIHILNQIFLHSILATEQTEENHVLHFVHIGKPSGPFKQLVTDTGKQH